MIDQRWSSQCGVIKCIRETPVHGYWKTAPSSIEAPYISNSVWGPLRHIQGGEKVVHFLSSPSTVTFQSWGLGIPMSSTPSPSLGTKSHLIIPSVIRDETASAYHNSKTSLVKVGHQQSAAQRRIVELHDRLHLLRKEKSAIEQKHKIILNRLNNVIHSLGGDLNFMLNDQHKWVLLILSNLAFHSSFPLTNTAFHKRRTPMMQSHPIPISVT